MNEMNANSECHTVSEMRLLFARARIWPKSLLRHRQRWQNNLMDTKIEPKPNCVIVVDAVRCGMIGACVCVRAIIFGTFSECDDCWLVTTVLMWTSVSQLHTRQWRFRTNDCFDTDFCASELNSSPIRSRLVGIVNVRIVCQLTLRWLSDARNRIRKTTRPCSLFLIFFSMN